MVLLVTGCRIVRCFFLSHLKVDRILVKRAHFFKLGPEDGEVVAALPDGKLGGEEGLWDIHLHVERTTWELPHEGGASLELDGQLTGIHWNATAKERGRGSVRETDSALRSGSALLEDCGSYRRGVTA